MNNNLIGLKFYDSKMDELQVIEYSNRFKGYLLSKNGVMNGLYDIVQESDIERYLSKQEKWIESDKKYREAERLEREKQEAEEKAYNNTYGFCNNMKALQKGKVLKILNKTENYFSNGEYVGTIKRKDFIKNILDAGGNIEHKTDLKYYAKNCELKVKANEYRLYCFGETSFYELNKTEFDYAMYLKSLLN